MNIRRRILLTAGILAASSFAGGCFLAGDLVNPALFQQFGIDPNTVIPSRGSMIVNFNNQSNFPASLNIVIGENPVDLTAGVNTFNIPSRAMDSFNEVIDCPANFISFGEVGDDFAYTPTAVDVITDGGDVVVMYMGSNLVQNRDYACGDLINVTLIETAGAGGADGMNNANFALTVQVLRGR